MTNFTKEEQCIHALEDIYGIGFDYDGSKNMEEMEDLVDTLVEIASSALRGTYQYSTSDDKVSPLDRYVVEKEMLHCTFIKVRELVRLHKMNIAYITKGLGSTEPRSKRVHLYESGNTTVCGKTLSDKWYIREEDILSEKHLCDECLKKYNLQ